MGCNGIRYFTFDFGSRSANLNETNEQNELNANSRNETKLMGLIEVQLFNDAIQHLATLDYEVRDRIVGYKRVEHDFIY